MNRQINVLAIGDSLIKAKTDNLKGWAWRFAKEYSLQKGGSLKYYNEGNGGDTTREILLRIEPALNKESYWDLIIIGVGINDSRKRGTPPIKYEVDINQFQNNFRKILKIIRGQSNKFGNCIVSGICLVVEELLQPFKEGKYYYRKDSEDYNSIIEDTLKEFPEFIFVDFASIFSALSKEEHKLIMPDGLHPSSEGHKILFNFARRKIMDKVIKGA